MAKLSLRQAAQQVGVSKSTILRAVQKGRLSAARTDDGGYAIDPSELQRFYGDRAAQQSSTDAMGQDAPGDATPALRAEIDGLKAMLDMMRDQVDDVRGQRDGWQKQAENSQRLLADMRPARRGWFGLGRTG
jgi:excisionase family DNA binding protein